MDGVPVKKLARDIGIGIDKLTLQLADIGISICGPDDVISGTDQLRLLQHIRANEEKDVSGNEVALEDIEAANELADLNQLLTRSMAERKIQELIKGRNFEAIVDKVLELNDESSDSELLCAAILGRLAAVSHKNKKIVYDRIPEVFSTEPAAIDSLDDGDAKNYAVQIISRHESHWTQHYCYEQIFVIDAADIARRGLLTGTLKSVDDLTEWLSDLAEAATALNEIENVESRYKRARRIAVCAADVVRGWRGPLGDNPGGELANFAKSLFKRTSNDVEFTIIVEGLDALLEILRRLIEIHFSQALYPELYEVLTKQKSTLGGPLWRRYLDNSEVIPDIQHALLEAALVLARQDKYDHDFLSVIRGAYSSLGEVQKAMQVHFRDARDLSPEAAEWWQSGGTGEAEKEQKAQRILNSEDEMIGELLLKVEESQTVIEKLGDAVLPLLKTSNPVLAKTVEKATFDFRETTRVTRRLAGMRKLEVAGLKSERLEYNRREHDMVNGHRSGIRKVRVVRDGVKKEFAGSTRMIIKPMVEPER